MKRSISRTHSFFRATLSIAIFCSAFALHAESQDYREGKLAFSSRDYDRAVQLFRSALQQEPSNGNPLFYIGYIQELQNKKPESIESYKRAVELRMDPDLKEKAFWKIVLYYKYNEDWTSLYLYADKFLKFRDSSQVQKLRDLADENRDPEMLEIHKKMDAADKLEQYGDYQGAAIGYRSILDKRPDFQPARWKLALILMKNNDFSGAATELKNLIALSADFWQYHYKLSVCLYRLGDYDGSLGEISLAQKYNEQPDEAFKYYMNLSEGMVRLEKGDYGKAEELLKKTLKKNKALSYGGLARARLALGKSSLAKKEAHKALSLEREQKDALYVDYRIADQSGKEAKAMSDLQLLFSSIKREYGETTLYPLPFQRAMADLGVRLYAGKNLNRSLAAFRSVDLSRIDLTFSLQDAKEQKGDSVTAGKPASDAGAKNSTPPHLNSLRNRYLFFYASALLDEAEQQKPAPEISGTTTGGTAGVPGEDTKKSRLSLSRTLLQRLPPDPEVDFQMARSYALSSDSSMAESYLNRLPTGNPAWMEKIEATKTFQDLRAKDRDFAEFLDSRRAAGQ